MIEDPRKIHRYAMLARTTWLAEEGPEGPSIDLRRMIMPSSVPPGCDPPAWRVHRLYAQGLSHELIGSDDLPAVPSRSNLPPNPYSIMPQNITSQQMLPPIEEDISWPHRLHTPLDREGSLRDGRAKKAIADIGRSCISQSYEKPSDAPERGWPRSPYPPSD